MIETDDESTSCDSGFLTPPLSPSKTISTEGWSSPRTPGSPRKSRSCLFFRNIGQEIESPFSTPPPSPTKPKFAPPVGTLSVPEILPPTCDFTSPHLTDDSPVKKHVHISERASPRRSFNSVRANNRSLPQTITPSESQIPISVPSLESTEVPLNHAARRDRRTSHRSSSDSSIAELVAKYATPSPSQTYIRPDVTCNAGPSVNEFHSLGKPRRLPLRCSSSPLRPSQWTSRGGMLSLPRKSQTSTPDRFIHCRRPPAVTRESFELNKPIEREQVFRHGHRAGGDPFSHRVRRSERLNNELRSLREAHTVITERPGGNERNSNVRVRSSSLTLAARQISAGAVWNVGGPSAVSDTVAAVFTGRGGMLGSGTIAPLYTSTFLNRADPEAETEAYERRLALALEVDQTDRILQHSPVTSSHSVMKCSNTTSHAPHFWRDGAWTQNGVRPCLSFTIKLGIL